MGKRCAITRAPIVQCARVAGERCSRRMFGVAGVGLPPGQVHGHHPAPRPSARSRPTARIKCWILPLCPLTKTRRRPGGRPAIPTSNIVRASADRDRSSETLVLSCWRRRQWRATFLRARVGPRRAAPVMVRATAVAIRVSVSNGRWDRAARWTQRDTIDGDVLVAGSTSP